MKQKALTVIVLCLVLAFAAVAQAQQTPADSSGVKTAPTAAPMVKPTAAPMAAPMTVPFAKELCAYYGYAWTFAQDYNLGEVDIADKQIWGLSLDIPVRPGTWAELLFSSQTSDLTMTSGGMGVEVIDELSINYWQLGAVQALKTGKVVPFTSLSLGGTYVTTKDANVSEWYFSMILGAGAKVYMSERAGLRLQARLPISFTGGGFGAGIGTGGASVGFYGTGVTQIDVSAGAFVSF